MSRRLKSGLETVRALREAGIETYATLAPLLPCDPEELARAAIEASGRDLIGDPLHVRAVKPHGATTRDAAWRVSEVNGFDANGSTRDFRLDIVERIAACGRRVGKDFPIGSARIRAVGDMTSCMNLTKFYIRHTDAAGRARR